MRVLVTGSRDWPYAQLIRSELDDTLIGMVDSDSEETLTLVHGGCPTGVDKQADMWARQRIQEGLGALIDLEVHEADWDRHGKRAGYIRNAEMVKLGADVCLAFIHNGSNGATHTRDLAKEAGIPTETFERKTPMASAIDRTPVLSPLPYQRVTEEITFRDTRIIYRNFEGREGQYNVAGKRNFAIPLDEAQAVALHEAGWKVKERIREDGEHLYHLPVTVKMDGRKPPRIFLITMSKNRRFKVDAETAMMVDVAEFDRIDVTVRPFNWDVNGQRGVSAYLKIFMGTLHEDALELEYAHIPIEGEQPEVRELENVIDAQVEADTGWQEDQDEGPLELPY